MKQWRGLLAALLAALLLCALPMAATAELEIGEVGGPLPDLEVEGAEIEDGLAPDEVPPALDGLDLPQSEPVELPAGDRSNDGDEDFDIEDGVVVGYHGTGGNIVIPETATAIGPWAFYESPLVTGVTIPGNIREIGEGSFQFCPNLTRVTIEEGVTAIRNNAFSQCPKLKAVTVPGSVKVIEGAAFNTCGALKKLTLGNGIEEIGWYVFQNCTSLTKVELPESVKILGDGCFMGCSALTGIALPESLESIEQEAFKECTGLKSVTIPGSVRKLQGTFQGCASLEKATIKEGLEYLYDDVFGDCEKLKSVTLPNTLKHIGQGAFYSCAALQSIKIPKSVEGLESYAFAHCDGLTSVTIPAGLRKCEGNPFIGCRNLEKIVVAKGNTSFVFSGGLLYTRNMKTLICGVGTITDATIADGVKTIGFGAFDSCSRLKSVTIPGSVRTIDEGAFSSCARLKRVEIPAGVKTIGAWAFSQDTALQQVWIPASVTVIGEAAFIYEDDDGDYPLKATFIVEEGSYAQKYAKENGLTARVDLSKAKVTANDQVYTGKKLEPEVVVTLKKKTLRPGRDYTVSYKSNKAVGTATVTVTGKGDYIGKATGSFAINPRPVNGLKLTAGVKQLTANWSKANEAEGYQIEYSLDKKFATSKKISIAKAATVQKVLKSLKSGKTYYVRIRAYRKVDGKVYWSAWSVAQSARVG